MSHVDYFLVHLWCFLSVLEYDRQGPELKTADQRLQWSLSLSGSRGSRLIKPNKSWKSSVSSLQLRLKHWEEPPERPSHQRESPQSAASSSVSNTEKNHRRDPHIRGKALSQQPPAPSQTLRRTTGETLTSEGKSSGTEQRAEEGTVQHKQTPAFPFPSTLSSLHPSLIVPPCYCACADAAVNLLQTPRVSEKPDLLRETAFMELFLEVCVTKTWKLTARFIMYFKGIVLFHIFNNFI